MSVVYAIILLVLVAVFVTSPFWRRETGSETESPVVANLEAAREAKYREIRDAETDLASGKLSEDDFERINAELKSDALEILESLEAAKSDDS
jgi:hypothetical protein